MKKQQYSTSSAIIVAGIIVAVALLFSRGGQSTNTAPIVEGANVTVVDGVQYIDISAKGGYSPRVTTAAAGIPSVIRMRTSGTFDCSSSLVFPSLNIRKNLPPSGTTEIQVPVQESGSTLRGLCSMGMYNFQVKFE